MKKLLPLLALVAAGCHVAPARFHGDDTTPSPAIPSMSRETSECPSEVKLSVIASLAQMGEPATWVRATYNTPAADAPQWAVAAADAEIRPFRPDLFIAYVVGRPGPVKVYAVGPCGATGSLAVMHGRR